MSLNTPVMRQLARADPDEVQNNVRRGAHLPSGPVCLWRFMKRKGIKLPKSATALRRKRFPTASEASSSHRQGLLAWTSRGKNFAIRNFKSKVRDRNTESCDCGSFCAHGSIQPPTQLIDRTATSVQGRFGGHAGCVNWKRRYTFSVHAPRPQIIS
ncbi:hypothetical protein OBBRIDRAFT_494912 [Obba rivulosa]|uniref:Uncharacterized protein n=1 Tax=Obba rivulosa TaxID=1052685 RepID=A0A8E2DNX1_9APHY|nr:hypothetical protein OBBRIDRAFT_494912 [Obba rivulosa]